MSVDRAALWWETRVPHVVEKFGATAVKSNKRSSEIGEKNVRRRGDQLTRQPTQSVLSLGQRRNCKML